jgi:hypothetical protein
MKTKPTTSTSTSAPLDSTFVPTETDQISQNINAVLNFHAHEDEKISNW